MMGDLFTFQVRYEYLSSFCTRQKLFTTFCLVQNDERYFIFCHFVIHDVFAAAASARRLSSNHEAGKLAVYPF